MKKIILSLILFTLPLSAQTIQNNLLSLEHEARVINNSKVPEMQIPLEKTKKSVGLAILYSLLLPGMGELYAGNYASGKYFTIAEGALWGGYLGINTYGNWLKDRYTSYAQSTGGVNTSGKDEDYFAIIGEYTNIEQYNNEQALDRNFDAMLNETTHAWKWSSEQERRSYRNMWVSSEQAFNSLRFIVGGLIVNRVISAINAVRLTAAYNKSLKTETGWNVSVGTVSYPGIPTGLSLNLTAEF